MKSQKKFNVTITFKRETDYYLVDTVDLVLPTLEGTDENKEKIILEALSNLSSMNLEDLEEKINLDEATISKLSKKSESLKEFSFLVHKELVQNNMYSLAEFYEGRDGDPGITAEEVLESGDFENLYGCEFSIEESTIEDFNNKIKEEAFIDLCNKKKESEIGKEVKAIKERMMDVLLRVRKTDDPIELDILSTEYIDLSKELAQQEKIDFHFERYWYIRKI